VQPDDNGKVKKQRKDPRELKSSPGQKCMTSTTGHGYDLPDGAKSLKGKPAKLNKQPILKGERVEGGSWSTKRRLQEKSPSRIGNGPSMERM